MRLQPGKPWAATDDLLFYLEQEEVGTWLLELITQAL